ncbi:MAG: hypothetical protein HN389_00980 [Clostridia bacterium]|jgi:hypothetical protein|nr:hypothetical protein [Clostridia bacterium]
MKKLLVLIVVTVLLLSACTQSSTSSYTFRGHNLGDSLEDVIEKEGIESYEQSPRDRREVDFIVNDFFGYEAEMTCHFEDDSLYMISMLSVYTEKNGIQDEVFDEMVQNLTELYGEPYWTKIGDTTLTASWQKEGLLGMLDVTPYSIGLSVNFSYKGLLKFHY